jgi:hypothetical protein
MRKTIAIAALAKLTATAALVSADLGRYTGFADFELTAKNDAGSTPTLDVKLQHSDPLARGHSYLVEGATSTKLKTGASTLVKLAATFTQSGAASLKQVSFKLKKIGTLAAGKKVTVELCADNAGAPGTAITSTTIDIDTEVGTDFATVLATFAVAADVADATVYHLVLSADYTASATNCVVLRSNDVASGGNLQTFDATNWTLDTTEKVEVVVEQFVFADITGGAFTQVTTAANRQIKTLWADSLKRHVRPYVTIGGTSSPAFYVGIDVVAQDRYS